LSTDSLASQNPGKQPLEPCQPGRVHRINTDCQKCAVNGSNANIFQDLPPLHRCREQLVVATGQPVLPGAFSGGGLIPNQAAIMARLVSDRLNVARAPVQDD